MTDCPWERRGERRKARRTIRSWGVLHLDQLRPHRHFDDLRSRARRSHAAQGITGTHEWRFERTGEGVRLTTNESFAGDPVEADTAGMQAVLDNSLSAWLARMKAQAESTD